VRIKRQPPKDPPFRKAVTDVIGVEKLVILFRTAPKARMAKAEKFDRPEVSQKLSSKRYQKRKLLS
jgi:hypothetical protein